METGDGVRLVCGRWGGKWALGAEMLVEGSFGLAEERADASGVAQSPAERVDAGPQRLKPLSIAAFVASVRLAQDKL